jgi:DNA-binding NtrC family response regulator
MSTARILCVDDDSHINELNEIVLTRAGYQVETAESPADALERFKSGGFDLVVTDLFSPQSSDTEFIAKLRKLAPSVPIIVVSGNDSPPPEILKQTEAFVLKAYSLNALTDSIREVLMRKKLRRIG